MANSQRSDPVIQLGRRIVSELKRDDSTASVWLAHLLAERLAAVDDAHTADDKRAAEGDCVTLILELWRRQSDFPSSIRPFRDVDAVIRTLEALNIDETPFYYFADTLRFSSEAGLSEAERQWLEFAVSADQVARRIIRHALREAVLAAGNSVQDWVSLAREVVGEEPVESRVVHIILDGDGTSHDRLWRERRQNELARLRAFIGIASQWAESLEHELAQEEP